MNDFNNNLFIKTIKLNREKIESFDNYPFNIDIIKNFNELKFDSPVSFLIGENGIGKSTFIEALAVSLGLNAEGGTQNFTFSTNNTTSNLSNYLTILTYGKPKTKFFLRAESFYNVATEIDNLEVSGYGTKSLHNYSHGESFIELIQNRFTEKGLYILDEPEAALSPQRQMSLLCMIDDLVKQGCQFIISTHSPILISYREGTIYDLNSNFKKTNYEDTDIYQLYKLFLNRYEPIQEQLFNKENN